MPELSYGSHFFQDLVETGIFYAAIFENQEDVIYRPELLSKCHELIKKMLPDEKSIFDIVKVYDTSSMNLLLLSDTASEKTVCIEGESL